MIRCFVVLSLLVSLSCASLPKDPASFGTLMARKGLWKEAKYRWEQALKENPQDWRLLNNLAVAEEVLGNPKKAKELYKKALSLKNHRKIKENLDALEKLLDTLAQRS